MMRSFLLCVATIDIVVGCFILIRETYLMNHHAGMILLGVAMVSLGFGVARDACDQDDKGEAE